MRGSRSSSRSPIDVKMTSPGSWARTCSIGGAPSGGTVTTSVPADAKMSLADLRSPRREDHIRGDADGKETECGVFVEGNNSPEVAWNPTSHRIHGTQHAFPSAGSVVGPALTRATGGRSQGNDTDQQRSTPASIGNRVAFFNFMVSFSFEKSGGSHKSEHCSDLASKPHLSSSVNRLRRLRTPIRRR